MRRRARQDANQREIVTALQQLGAEVFDCSSVGSGFPDLAVQFRGVVQLLEVKARRGRLTADQVAFHRRWRVAIVRSVDEAMQAVGMMRS